MTSFSRGRGIYRPNNISSIKPGVTAPNVLCTRLLNEMQDMNLNEVKTILILLANENEEKWEEIYNFLLASVYQDEDFAISFMRIYHLLVKDHKELINQTKFRKIILHDLQKKYEEIDKFKEDHLMLRSFSCLLVAQFISRDNDIGYTFLVNPIITSFTLLLNSKNSENIDLLAVLYLTSWNRLKITAPQEFESFLPILRKELLNCNYFNQKVTLLFLIDMSIENSQNLCSTLCEFYQKNLHHILLYKLRNWVDNEHVKTTLQDGQNEAVEKSLSDVKISETVETASKEIPKQTVPRAIRGTGAIDK